MKKLRQLWTCFGIIALSVFVSAKECEFDCAPPYFAEGFVGLCHASGKTALANSQAPFSSMSPELVSAFRMERTYVPNAFKGGAFQATLFGGQSTHATQKNLAAYFFPNGKTVLSVADDDLVDNFNKKKDLLAQNFNIFSKNGDFRSEISIAPEQSVVGCGFYWRQSLLHDPLVGDGLWLSVSTPLLQVRNRMNLHEDVINTGGGPDESAGVPVVANMAQAFNQDSWLFGKITDCVMKKTGLGDIEFKFGYDQYAFDEPSHMELYLGVIIPTSNKNKGEYIFEPIIGRGRHAGLMFGGALGKNMMHSYAQEAKFLWELAVHGEYLFKNKQVRSFDLMHKPWSRYLPVYASKEQAQEAFSLQFSDRNKAQNLSTPGINVLTQHVNVTPGFSCDMNSAFVIEYENIQAEVGYNFFLKRAECVTLACPWEPVVAIKYVNGVGQTNPVRDIAGNKYFEQFISNNSDEELVPVALADFDQSIIYETDLDLLSATTPALLAHTLYATVGAAFDDKKYPLMVSGGISYTFSQDNAVIGKWLMWLKSGFSF